MNLLPCPFCGSVAELGHGSDSGPADDIKSFYVQCSKCPAVLGFECQCDYGSRGEFATEDEAEAAWNQRINEA